MRYVLSQDVALRSWNRTPFAYYVRGERLAARLTREEFALLARCDGTRELEESPILAGLLERGLAREAAAGETWGRWSAPRAFENSYFPVIDLAVTGRCNCSCRHCFMAADNAPMLGEHSFDQLAAILDDCVACGVQSVTVMGGEPLAHPRFRDFLREVARRDMDIYELFTNGIELSDDLLALIGELGLSPVVKISFDGLGHHDWMRNREGSEHEALDAMRRAIAHGLRVHAQTSVHRGNLDTLLETMVLLDGMGVDEARVIRTTESPRWLENGGDEALSFSEYNDAMLELAGAYAKEERGMCLDLWMFCYLDPQARTYRYFSMSGGVDAYRDSQPVCKGARGKVSVDFEGNVIPCQPLAGTMAALGKNFGNVHDTPLGELLQAKDYLAMSKLTAAQVREANAPCRECPYWKLCVGGCRALALGLGGRYDGVDPTRCTFFKGGYLDKIDRALAGAPLPWRCGTDTAGIPRPTP